ncbi:MULTISPECIES: methyltransferase type 11 [Brucella]|uniref:Methyltransferase type 11 n=1 Tax=Brucella tritici TaxID=94626 RepID=A0A6L3YDQ9_9HYPH|nr:MULTISPECIES: methyltransferase type 11 [Brucella]KAB2681150.1 methyltransferase type 11 [Brucella tritici]KAB2757369.1 methyltransferase type 11 [Brucella anthropi]KAB2775296.1 methyltransferase type 11 [Brucella anthropi]
MKANVYSRPAKPLWVSVKQRDDFEKLAKAEPIEIVAVDKATECHVTPDNVADRMVSYLGPTGDYLTLEPSAGTGQLTKALLRSGHSQFELTQIERHIKLAAGLHKFGPVINRCFLEYASEAVGKVEFPRIIMNPPFREVRPHVKAALSLMGQNGHTEPATLVALVPITFEHPDAETLEVLPSDTFAAAKVNTKIIRIVKG